MFRESPKKTHQFLLALIYSNGTQVPSWALQNAGAGSQHAAPWVVPPGPRVIFLFRYVTKLVITLAAPEGGHTFYISLHSPDAEAAPVSLSQSKPIFSTPGPSVQEPMTGFPKHLGRAFALWQNKVVSNNFAGLGPGKGPPVLRYGETCSREGQNVDVVLQHVGHYHPQIVGLNGLNGSYAAAPIGVALDSSLKLHLSLVNAEDSPVPFEELYLTIFDVEEPYVGITADAVEVDDFKAVIWPDGSRVWARNLPKDWMPPQGPAPTYAFSTKQEISMTLHGSRRPGNAVSGPWQGHTFFLALHSPEAHAPLQKQRLPKVPHPRPIPRRPIPMGFQLALSKQNLVYNNLGGFGPGHLDDPLELRFAETCELRTKEGRNDKVQRVDVVFRLADRGGQRPVYLPGDVRANGPEEDRAFISVEPGSSVDVAVDFIKAFMTEDPGETRRPINLNAFICIEAPHGEVSLQDFEAVLFANNTLLAAGEAFGPFAAHEAPCFHVHTSSVRLTLEGKERFAEGPPDDKKSGFRIAIFSPEVQAYNEVARRQHKGQVKVRPLVTPSFGNQMILAKKNVICNNLGGYGPEKEKLAQLHYRGVAKLHGRPVDVVLEARPGYRPKKANLNGLSHNAASVNLAMGSAAELELRFLRASHQVQESEAQPVIFSKLFLRIFDSEEPIPTIRAGEVILHGAKAAYWPNGTAQLLPKVWTVPEGPAPMIQFDASATLMLTLKARTAAGNSVGSFWAGRTFFITMHSPDLIMEEGRHHVAGGSLNPQGDAALGVLLTNPSNVLYNNLGRKGPGHLDEPPIIRLDGVATWHQERLDMVVMVRPGSHYEPSGMNGVLDSGELELHVAFGSILDLEIFFCTSQESQVALEHLYLEVSDIQDPPSLAANGEVRLTDFEALRYANKSWIGSSTLRKDWPVPSGPAPILLFRNRTKLHVTLEAHPEGPFTGPGRRFLLRLYSPDVKAGDEKA
ncbi:Uncharacterized protein SCF082_LOCUS32524 [Durusdinium trenchii]|uniref:Uncharacterized protein n=1 Tax=Durusdinium trenchii TaxID=1381693 RepID=A0ABP0NH24_9DINO